jgi:hypothetical protein
VRVGIPTSEIVDEASFHRVVAQLIYCLGSGNRPADGLMAVAVPPGETLILEFEDAASFASRCPGIWIDLQYCVQAANDRAGAARSGAGAGLAIADLRPGAVG